jgi:hypothetical protein
MSEANYNIDRDLSEAKALAEHLVPYVYEDQIYGSIGGMFGSGSMPSLTIGGLLLRLDRLHALESQMNDAQKTQLAAVDTQHENARREWTIHYNNKLAAEANSRLKAIQQYLQDCKEEPKGCAYNYLPEANRRTVVQALVKAMQRHNATPDDLNTTLYSADAGLRRFTQPSDFILSGALKPAYPQDEYWWLYARPPLVEKK